MSMAEPMSYIIEGLASQAIEKIEKSFSQKLQKKFTKYEFFKQLRQVISQ